MGSIRAVFFILQRHVQQIYVGILLLLSLMRLFTVNFLEIPLTYSPHDQSLYVTRAYHLLTGHGFGPFNSTTLIKNPGISYWIAFIRSLGIPYFLSINLLYIFSGLFLLYALGKAGLGKAHRLCVFTLFLLNPVSYQDYFLAAMREPIYTAFLIILVSTLILILKNLLEQGIVALKWVLLFSTCLGFLVLIREEAQMLLVFPFLALIPIYRKKLGLLKWLRQSISQIALIIGLPLAFVLIFQGASILLIKKQYGVGLLNDFSSGEFPRFIAALRSIKAPNKSDYVSITQDQLKLVARLIPEFAPVFERMPPPPGPSSYYGDRYGVESEWGNSHIFFWIKDAAFHAGVTPSLSASQQYFALLSSRIESLCKDKKIDCDRDGNGLFPVVKIHWLPKIIGSFFMNLGRLGRTPKTDLARPTHPDIRNPEAVSKEQLLSLGGQYFLSTMTPFDSLAAFNQPFLFTPDRLEIQSNLEYWHSYPDVASSIEFGVEQHLTSEFKKKFFQEKSGTGKIDKTDPRMSIFLSEYENSDWKNFSFRLFLAIRYLLKSNQEDNRGLKNSPAESKLGARLHFDTVGHKEGRRWPDFRGLPDFPRNNLLYSAWLKMIPGLRIADSIFVFSAVVGAITFLCSGFVGGSLAFFGGLTIFLVYAMIKCAILAVISISMGGLDDRLFAPDHVVLVTFGVGVCVCGSIKLMKSLKIKLMNSRFRIHFL